MNYYIQDDEDIGQCYYIQDDEYYVHYENYMNAWTKIRSIYYEGYDNNLLEFRWVLIRT